MKAPFDHSWSLNSDIRATTGLVSLSRQDLVVMRSKLLTSLRPSIKVSLDVDAAANALLLPDTPELLEGSCADNARLVGTGSLVNVVGSTIGGDAALLGRSAAGIVRSKVLDDVVFNERVLSPAVEREIRVDGAVVPRARVCHVMRASRVPSLACDEVVDVVPLDAIAAGIQVVVGHAALAICPERVEETVISAGSSRSAAALKDKVEGRAKNGGCATESKQNT